MQHSEGSGLGVSRPELKKEKVWAKEGRWAGS